MKKLLTTIVLLSIMYSASAQWTIGGTNIYNSNTGYVGIGTNAPLNKFFVNAGENIKAIEIAGNNFNGSSATHYFPAISFYSTKDGTRPASASSEIVFSDRPGTFGYAVNSRASDILFYTAHSYDAGLNAYGMYPDISMVIRSTQDGGYVGIGRPIPNSRLDVNGAIVLPGSIGNTMARPAVGVARITGEIAGYNTVSPTGDDGFLRLSAGGGTNTITKTYIDLSGYSTIPDMDRNITFGTEAIERMRISNSGNVSIGTADSKGYLFAVNGSAITTSMTVKLNANWPDYVFRKDYQLPSLQEVKTYIDQNQHLPGMPSEAEVAKDGINLGEINKLLTKKVEELTLYLLEQQQLQKEQAGRITRLEQVLAELQKTKK